MFCISHGFQGLDICRSIANSAGPDVKAHLLAMSASELPVRCGDSLGNMPLTQNMGVELPNRVVEDRCETDPQQIRNEKSASKRTHAPERYEGGNNKDPK